MPERHSWASSPFISRRSRRVTFAVLGQLVCHLHFPDTMIRVEAMRATIGLLSLAASATGSTPSTSLESLCQQLETSYSSDTILPSDSQYLNVSEVNW